MPERLLGSPLTNEDCDFLELLQDSGVCLPSISAPPGTSDYEAPWV